MVCDAVMKGLARGVAKAKISHLVFSSVVCRTRWELSEELASMPHVRQKWVVNRLAVELGVPTTMLGPTHFADNWESGFVSITDGQINGLAEEDVKVPYVTCRDIGRLALLAANIGPPSEGRRYLPAFTDFVSGKEILRLLETWHRKQFNYWNPPDFVLRFLSPEGLMMKQAFTKYGRPPYSTAPETLEQMYECRKLLQGDFWTLETWLREHGFDKHLRPTPVPLWQKALITVSVLGASAALFWWMY